MIFDESSFDLGKKFLEHYGVKGMRWGIRNDRSSDPILRARFINELGNDISMDVVSDDRGITVSAAGPTSQVEHTWTPLEAQRLRDLLNQALG